MGKKKKKADKMPEATIDDALSRAQVELERAKTCYENLRRGAFEKIENARKTNLGDVIDGTLETVKRHPAAGLGVAALLGFFIGRLFRR
ncbi:MAG: hypothetical protein JW959_14555 [Pirellulales bacterium]|nr:hypothetical protein [Pirellulales bacterium]